MIRRWHVIAATAVGIWIAGWGIALSACTPAANPAQVRADARAVVSLAEDAWMTTAQACIDVATEKSDQSVLDGCRKVLEPARDELLAAASSIDAWQAADQANLPCLVSAALAGIGQEETALKALGVTLPQAVDDVFTAARSLVGACVPAADGGSNG